VTEIVLRTSGQVVRLPHTAMSVEKNAKFQPVGLRFENPETEGVKVVYIDFTDVSIVTTSSAPMTRFEDTSDVELASLENLPEGLRPPLPEM
jgi:hypothetical protein